MKAALRRTSRVDFQAFASSAGVGLVGAWAAVHMGMPLAWFLGPMIFNAIAAVAGMPLKGPFILRPIALPILGVLLGTAFGPEIFVSASNWALTIALVPVCLMVSGAASYGYFRTVAKYDPVTSYFSSVPGGLTAMIILGEHYGGDTVRIAIAQSMRILSVVLIVALFFALYLGVSRSNTPRAFTPFDSIAPIEWIWLLGCAVLGTMIGKRLHFPTHDLVGPLFLSAALHSTSVLSIGPPTVLAIFAQFVLGACIGVRFVNLDLRAVFRYFVHGLNSSLLLLGISAIFAGIVHIVSGIRYLQALLAFSPGGITEMGLMSLAIGQGVAYVTISHVIRILVVLFTAPALIRILRRVRSQ